MVYEKPGNNWFNSCDKIMKVYTSRSLEYFYEKLFIMRYKDSQRLSAFQSISISTGYQVVKLYHNKNSTRKIYNRVAITLKCNEKLNSS